MTSQFLTYRIEPENRSSTNTRNDSEGRFYKYWCIHPELGRCLFKACSPDGFTPAERRLDWSEKVAAELGQLFGLPVAQTELAVGYALELEAYIDGTLSVDYTPSGGQILSGREFMSIVDPLYDVERSDGTDSYTVENILQRLEQNFVGLPKNWNPLPGIKTGADLMVGYLLFDAWLSATDRHDENWELALLNDGYLLCPTFDHGDSLGVKLSLAELFAKSFEHPKSIESCWWQNQTIDKQVQALEISTIDAFTIATEIRPLAARAWLQRLNLIKPRDVTNIFARIPKERLNAEQLQFAINLLVFNQQQLLLEHRG